MKKLALLLAFASSFTFVNAQDDADRLPAAGDIGLGFDAVPALRYLGNVANGTTNNSINSNYYPGYTQTLMGKYFLSENTAVRGRLRIGYGSESFTRGIDDIRNTDPATPKYVDDKLSVNAFNLSIGGGIEKRRGYGRLQGYYGGELMIGLSSLSRNYTYGNSVDNNNLPSAFAGSTNFAASGDDSQVNTDGASYRTLSMKSGSIFSVGVRGFIGVEYFILPKISLGAEFGWGPSIQMSGRGSVTNERINNTNNGVIEEEREGLYRRSNFNLDVDNLGGGIFMMFHF
jgi:hypothetical protein